MAAACALVQQVDGGGGHGGDAGADGDGGLGEVGGRVERGQGLAAGLYALGHALGGDGAEAVHEDRDFGLLAAVAGEVFAAHDGLALDDVLLAEGAFEDGEDAVDQLGGVVGGGGELGVADGDGGGAVLGDAGGGGGAFDDAIDSLQRCIAHVVRI